MHTEQQITFIVRTHILGDTKSCVAVTVQGYSGQIGAIQIHAAAVVRTPNTRCSARTLVVPVKAASRNASLNVSLVLNALGCHLTLHYVQNRVADG